MVFTGKELESATEQFIKFADITGTDVTSAVRLVSRAIENGGMEAKDHSASGYSSQRPTDTGMASVDNPGRIHYQERRNNAFNWIHLHEGNLIAMLAQFEKAVNSETAVAGLKKQLVNGLKKDGTQKHLSNV